MKNRVYVFLLALLVCPVYAQSTMPPAWSAHWDSKHGVFRAKDKRFESQFQGIPNADFSAEAAAVLKDNPSAPLLCAAVALWQGPIQSEGHKKLRDAEVELCKAHSPSPQQLKDVQAYLYPPPPPHHTVIAQKLQTPDSTGERWVGGVYYPGPAAPMAWARGEVSGRDYRADLEAQFNADPLIAARVCSRADIAAAQSELVFQQQQATLKSVCSAFPDQKIDAAYNAWHTQWSRAWLTGLLNSSLDEAASYSPDVRQQKEEEALATLSKMAGAMTTRFEAALRIIALAPDDWRGADALLQHLQEATWSGDHNADPDVVDAWLTETYKQKSAAGSDRLAWKRGLRSWLAMNGHLEDALAVAREIVGANQRDQHSRDVIYVAAIERALGTRASYNKLMSNCPAPDALYMRLNGAPSRPVKYCEDIVADFARAAREQLRGTKAGDAFAEMAVETNRVVPAAQAVVAIAQTPAKSAEAATDDWFLAALKAQEDRVAVMTNVQRQEAMNNHLTGEIYRLRSLDKALYLMFLEPDSSGAAGALLVSSQSLPDNRPARVKNLLLDYYRKRSASGADANEWKRGLRAFLLYSGDYAGARSLGRELAAQNIPKYRTRDVVTLALLDRIDGNRKPLDDAIANCPGRPKEEVELYGELPDKTIYCRSTVIWDIARTSLIAAPGTVPHACAEFLQESASPNLDEETRSFAITELQHIDPALARVEWLKYLATPDLPLKSRADAYASLSFIAELQKQPIESIKWIDQFIAVAFRQPVPFTPTLWSIVAQIPESPSSRRSGLVEMFDRRFRMALEARDYANARRTIEDFATYTQCGEECSRAYVFDVRRLLLSLADAEASAGQHQEPLRILGYLATNPLTEQMTLLINDVRKKLNAEPKRENTPWDSPARDLPKRPKQQEPAKASKIST